MFPEMEAQTVLPPLWASNRVSPESISPAQRRAAARAAGAHTADGATQETVGDVSRYGGPVLESGPVPDLAPSMIDVASDPAASEVGGTAQAPQTGTDARAAWAEEEPLSQSKVYGVQHLLNCHASAFSSLTRSDPALNELQKP